MLIFDEDCPPTGDTSYCRAIGRADGNDRLVVLTGFICCKLLTAALVRNIMLLILILLAQQHILKLMI